MALVRTGAVQRRWRRVLVGVLAVRMIREQIQANEGRHGRKKRRPRSVWVKDWLLRRPEYGLYEKLLAELQADHLGDFKNFLRIDPDLYHEILTRVAPLITKKHTFMREPLEPGLKLVITLRYLASGDIYPSIMYGFRVARNTISLLIPETCRALNEVFQRELIKSPKTEAEWLEVASDFWDKWNFPNCLGAVDGKHIAIKCPRNMGSAFYNYKGFHSIVLMALVDAKYRFRYIDIGANGACADGGLFKECGLYEALDGQYAGVPQDRPLPNDDVDMPLCLVADDAFALRTWLMKPYPHKFETREERIFNYRLSRARRVVENAFGILAQRFRCLLTTMQQAPTNVEVIGLCCCVMHNLLIDRRPGQMLNNVDMENANHQVIPGTWRDKASLQGLCSLPGNTGIKRASHQRAYLKSYFNSPIGRVEWQDEMI